MLTATMFDRRDPARQKTGGNVDKALSPKS